MMKKQNDNIISVNSHQTQQIELTNIIDNVKTMSKELTSIRNNVISASSLSQETKKKQRVIMDSFIEFLSNSVSQCNKDRSKLAKLEEYEIQNEIDIQYQRNLIINLKDKFEKIKNTNPLNNTKNTKKNTNIGASSQRTINTTQSSLSNNKSKYPSNPKKNLVKTNYSNKNNLKNTINDSTNFLDTNTKLQDSQSETEIYSNRYNKSGQNVRLDDDININLNQADSIDTYGNTDENRFSLITFAEKTDGGSNINVPFTLIDKENLNECLRLVKQSVDNIKRLQNELSEALQSNRQLTVRVETLEAENESIKSQLDIMHREQEANPSSNKENQQKDQSSEIKVGKNNINLSDLEDKADFDEYTTAQNNQIRSGEINIQNNNQNRIPTQKLSKNINQSDFNNTNTIDNDKINETENVDLKMSKGNLVENINENQFNTYDSITKDSDMIINSLQSSNENSKLLSNIRLDAVKNEQFNINIDEMQRKYQSKGLIDTNDKSIANFVNPTKETLINLKQRNNSQLNDAKQKLNDFREELNRVEQEFDSLDTQMLKSNSPQVLRVRDGRDEAPSNAKGTPKEYELFADADKDFSSSNQQPTHKDQWSAQQRKQLDSVSYK